MSDYKLVVCIAQRGRKDDIVSAALEAGANGITYFDASGTGTRQKLGIKGWLISADKQVFLIVCRSEEANNIFNAVVKTAKINEPAMGFAFMTDVEKAVGFLQK